MTNSTDEYFSFDGKSLQTYAYNIVSWGGSRESVPDLRGSDIVIPGAPGHLYQEKQVDARTMTLSMWVVGANEDGSVPTSGSSRATFMHNWKVLRSLLFARGREVTITKRWHDFETGKLVTATGKGSYAGGLEPVLTGRTRAAFTVDIRMTDPFFYGDEVTVPAFTGVNQQQTISVAGDYRTTAITVDINGARVNPRIAVSNAYSSMWVKYTYALGSSDKAFLSVPDFRSRTTPGAGTTFRSGGLMTHGGDRFWLGLEPGSNQVSLTSTSGTGNIIIKYRPVWF